MASTFNYFLFYHWPQWVVSFDEILDSHPQFSIQRFKTKQEAEDFILIKILES